MSTSPGRKHAQVNEDTKHEGRLGKASHVQCRECSAVSSAAQFTAIGQRSFTVNGPRTWNSLPANLRTPDTTLCSFKRHLKAHLFQQQSTLLLTGGSAPFVRHHCDCLASSAPFTLLQLVDELLATACWQAVTVVQPHNDETIYHCVSWTARKCMSMPFMQRSQLNDIGLK